MSVAQGMDPGGLLAVQTGNDVVHCRQVIGVEDLPNAGAQHFLRGIAEMVGVGGAGVAASAVEIAHGDQIVHVIHDGAKQSLTPLQGIFRGLALRDVVELHKEAGHMLVCIQHRGQPN